MFTSQGCSSCPPADRLLTKLAKEPGVLALGYHVDYWDYIGWRDIFGSAANTERQRAYAQAFATTTIYTPQMVVNGRKGVVGSHEAKIRKLMRTTALPAGDGTPKVALSVEGDRLHITADVGELDPDAPAPVLMLVTFDDEATTTIERGENSGRTIVNTRPVRDWRLLGMASEEPMDIDLPLASLLKRGEPNGGCAVILQSVTRDGVPGPILAAAQMDFDDP
nr:DUF1223 domain-containing protein [Aurantimonas marina]